MYPDRGIVPTYRRLCSLSTRPYDHKTLTCQSTDMNYTPRDPLSRTRYIGRQVHTSRDYTNPVWKSGENHLFSHPKKWGNGKVPRRTGGNSVQSENLEGIQEPFCTIVEGLPNHQEGNIFSPLIWRCSKPCSGSIIPNDDSR